MRNRTAIRLLYVLAVMAGVLPPLLFLAFAYQQSVRQVERELEFVNTGTLARTESVLDTVGSTLRKVATITQGTVDESTVATLRQAVFLDRYVQAIGIRRGDLVLCSSEHLFNPPERLLNGQASVLPPPGHVEVRPPVERGFPGRSLVVLYAFGNDLAVEGLVNPALFSEFFDFYARESSCRVLVKYGSNEVLTEFGERNLRAPRNIDLTKLDQLQWTDGQVIRVTRSKKYPVFTITIARDSLVTSRWTSSALEFGLGGMIVSALLSGLVIRVARRTQSLESDLREAVKYGEIDVHYQPIIELATGRCVGAEALMRWNHPRRGTIPASEFIAVAERTDLILPMTEVALKKIASALGPVLQRDPALHIGVNLAPQHFASTHIVDAFRAATIAGLPPKQIIFEITERGLVSDEDAVARTVMNGFAAMGAKLAVDDFGTGYSSLSYLQRFPLDYLKVDKAFVDGISSATESSGLVDQVIRIAKSLNLEIIAEGIEQNFQAQYLMAHGVEFGQGWFYGRPMPARKFEEFVRARNAGNRPRPVPAGNGLPETIL